jgi:hypothetical protein
MYRAGPPQALLPMGVNFHSDALVQGTDSASRMISACAMISSSSETSRGSFFASSQEITSREIKKIAMRFIVFVFSQNEKPLGFATPKLKKKIARCMQGAKWSFRQQETGIKPRLLREV